MDEEEGDYGIYEDVDIYEEGLGPETNPFNGLIGEEPVAEGEEGELQPEVEPGEAPLPVIATGGRHITPKEQRRSLPIMTIYEANRVIGVRANQIDLDAPGPLIDTQGETSPVKIAFMELQRGVIDHIRIQRPLPDGSMEIWDLNELRLPSSLYR